LKQALKNQKERAQLEERRFRIGRVPTLTVIQAGDDATEAEINLSQSEIERRLAAWQVKRLAKDLEAYIKSLTQS